MLARRFIGFVQHQHRRAGRLLETGNDVERLGFGRVELGIDQQRDFVGVGGSFPGRFHHRPFEPPFRSENTGGVDEDDLSGSLDGDPQQARARGLRLGRHDGDLGSDQRVDEGRLAGIGSADDRHEPASGRLWRRLQARFGQPRSSLALASGALQGFGGGGLFGGPFGATARCDGR